MKIKLLFFLLLFSSIWEAQNVNIPDANFKSYLLGNLNINTNGDSEIQVSEANNFTGSIDCSNKLILSLEGIEYFTNITDLNCSDNQLTSLDLSSNTSLIYLLCGYNQLSNLHLENNTELIYIDCYKNKLTSLDVSKNTALSYLNCGTNELASLDVTKNTALVDLMLPYNLVESIDVTKNTKLKNFFCYSNEITNLDLSKNLDLKFLSSYNNNLTSLDLSKNTALTDLVTGRNQITALDLSKNLILNYLDCSQNQLTSLNLKNGNNSEIVTMDATSNPNITCIQVDDVGNANSYVSAGKWLKEATISFTTDCFLATSESPKDKITIFPNPIKDIVNLSKNANLVVYNTVGQQVASAKDASSVDLSKFSSGLYIIVILDKNGIEIQRNKVIKK